MHFLASSIAVSAVVLSCRPGLAQELATVAPADEIAEAGSFVGSPGWGEHGETA
jgi:hypothetical protein